MAEYGRLQRSGELLQANDEFRGSRTVAKAEGNKARSQHEECMFFGMMYVDLLYVRS